ncbi:MAG: hypothetical protein CMO74_11225 [Verrucomicrobiales bacterium]|nr:hypothetical protein [Verrucomicrobiales bacterium]|tara:strand:- start:56485 stop:57012 length:528 start_codon:yes stop_codon:yes gene_type:complete
MNATHPSAVPAKLLDIKPPIENSDPWSWLPWAFALAVLLAFLVAGLLWVYRRTGETPPGEPPHIEAMRKLSECKKLIGEPATVCALLSDTIRVYLAEKFTLQASERTTDEILDHLRTCTLLNKEELGLAEDFLRECDDAKFAGTDPSGEDMAKLHEMADRLVHVTAFKPAPPKST